MKKSVFLGSVLAAVVAGGVFAQVPFSVSAGGGGFIGGDFGGGIEIKAGGVKSTIETPYFGGGGFLFLDATYAELDVGIFGGGGEVKASEAGQSIETDWSVMNLSIGLLGKYPFAIGESFSLFPLLGLEYDIFLSAKDKDGDKIKNTDGDDATGDFNALWFKAGIGFDVEFIPQLYLRLEALYGLRLPNKYEDDYKKSVEKAGASAETRLGHGLTVKLALGYKFF